ncbi:hypothetical protein [Sulfurihydrogenibium azorense]|uniref:hypothetical protein n=1 Tax=Sulfurihydrogenibium azorense TaxID=309806 RepID=UPI00240912B0|nr:hypothetical protein [Sulfurihydrogenibium azorense]MDM7273959.1 hypothetical protein [Sulfurihydrogenibium azorense]
MRKVMLSVILSLGLIIPSFAAENVGEEVELSSAVIAAKSCAEKTKATGSFELLSSCPPVEAAQTGYVIYEVTENTFYAIAPKNIYYFELDEGFGGSIDAKGKIVKKEGDLPVLEIQEYKISPKPKAGFFKGCL